MKNNLPPGLQQLLILPEFSGIMNIDSLVQNFPGCGGVNIHQAACYCGFPGTGFPYQSQDLAFINLKRNIIPRIFFMSYLGINVIALTGIPVYASDIFATAKNAMQTVYTDVAGIATVAAVVCAAVCLFLMNFSKSGRTVDESRSWLKRIVVCWAALMTLGAIVTYLEKIIPKSMFTG